MVSSHSVVDVEFATTKISLKGSAVTLLSTGRFIVTKRGRNSRVSLHVAVL